MDANRTAVQQHQLIGVARSNVGPDTPPHTLHPDAQWFGNAGLGLFVHWGIASVHGQIDLSWGMQADTPWDSEEQNRLKPTPAEYFKLADRFKPDRYKPEHWLSVAARAGFTYAVLTTRHHDGYSMWPSDVGEFGVKQFLPGVDLVGPFVDACRQHGLKVGLYYSPPDWYYNRHYMSFRFNSDGVSRAHDGLQHEPLDRIPLPPAEFTAGFHTYVRAQVIELLTRYGQIDLLWFDGIPNVISLDDIRSYQPGIVINPRMHGHGDFETPECLAPTKRPLAWWERCDQWNKGGWGYAGEGYWPTAGMLKNLAETRAWGGNFLINCGPRPTGEMPDLYYARMAELTTWMSHSGESVMGTQGGPWPERSNVPVTVRRTTWYLHFTSADILHAQLTDVDCPIEVKLLRTGEIISFSYNVGSLIVPLPSALRTGLDDIVVVIWKIT